MPLSVPLPSNHQHTRRARALLLPSSVPLPSNHQHTRRAKVLLLPLSVPLPSNHQHTRSARLCPCPCLLHCHLTTTARVGQGLCSCPCLLHCHLTTNTCVGQGLCSCPPTLAHPRQGFLFQFPCDMIVIKPQINHQGESHTIMTTHDLLIKTNHYLIQGSSLTDGQKATITRQLLAAQSHDHTIQSFKKGVSAPNDRIMYPLFYVPLQQRQKAPNRRPHVSRHTHPLRQFLRTRNHTPAPPLRPHSPHRPRYGRRNPRAPQNHLLRLSRLSPR